MCTRTDLHLKWGGRQPVTSPGNVKSVNVNTRWRSRHSIFALAWDLCTWYLHSTGVYTNKFWKSIHLRRHPWNDIGMEFLSLFTVCTLQIFYPQELQGFPANHLEPCKLHLIRIRISLFHGTVSLWIPVTPCKHLQYILTCARWYFIGEFLCPIAAVGLGVLRCHGNYIYISTT